MNIDLHTFRNIVTQAVTETIENMTFMAVDSAEETPDETEAADWLKSSQLILEPYQGEVGLIMSKKLATEIACTLYSMDDREITENMMSDVVAELINTITGDIARRLLSGGSEFKLGLPEPGDTKIFEKASFPVHCTFSMEGQLLSVTAHMESCFQEDGSEMSNSEDLENG